MTTPVLPLTISEQNPVSYTLAHLLLRLNYKLPHHILVIYI